VLSAHLQPPAAEMDAAAAARVEVLRADVAAKREASPHTHGKGHRAHKSRDAGAKDKLKQMRQEHDAELQDAKHEHKHHHEEEDEDEEEDTLFEADESDEEPQ
jgi:hypothetical protein